MLFGKVPQGRQVYLSAISFGSIIWIVVLLGIAFPWIGTFLLTAASLPKWIDKRWIRVAMLAGVVVIPAVVGIASLLMLDPEDRPANASDKAKAVLKGYPYTVGFAVTLIMLIVIAPMLKLRNALRRWTDRHVAVIVEAQNYRGVVENLQAALAVGGIKTRQARASWMVRVPTKVLSAFAGSAIHNIVADTLTVLVGGGIEVLMHPSDLVVSGRERDVAHAQAIISEHLTFTNAYLTWEKEANEIEDRLRIIWAMRDRSDVPLNRLWEHLRRVERDLKSIKLPYEEWEVLFREISLIKVKLCEERAPQERPTGQSGFRTGDVMNWIPLVRAAIEFLAGIPSAPAPEKVDQGRGQRGGGPHVPKRFASAVRRS